MCSANGNALQIVFSNSSYESTEKWEGDLSDFQRRHIVGVRLAGTSVTKTATLLGVSREAVSKFMTAYTNYGKTSSARSNSGRKPKLSERDRRTLKRIVCKILELLQQRLQHNSIVILKTLSTKTVRRELHKSNIHSRAATAKPLITENNAKWRQIWCDDHKTWTSDDWKYTIRSGESSFTLFTTSGRVYVWRTPQEAHNPVCLVTTVRHGSGSVTIWATMSCYSAGPTITTNGQITASEYVDIVGN